MSLSMNKNYSSRKYKSKKKNQLIKSNLNWFRQLLNSWEPWNKIWTISGNMTSRKTHKIRMKATLKVNLRSLTTKNQLLILKCKLQTPEIWIKMIFTSLLLHSKCLILLQVKIRSLKITTINGSKLDKKVRITKFPMSTELNHHLKTSKNLCNKLYNTKVHPASQTDLKSSCGKNKKN